MSSSDSAAPITRRNTISSFPIPSKLHIPSKLRVSSFPIASGADPCFPDLDFDLISLKSLDYTSLKDLLPPSPDQGAQSPTTAVRSVTGSEMSIRIRLVKQAACEYLQQVSASPDSSGAYFFRRLWGGFSTRFLMRPVKACVRFFNQRVFPAIARLSDRILGVISIGRR